MKGGRAVMALSLAGLVIMGWGCGSKTTTAPPATEPPPVTSERSPTPETSPPPAAGAASDAFLPAFFAVDSHDLGSDARAALDHNAQVLLDNPRLNITIEGHCDERGTVEYNLALGERRARAARNYLLSSGIASSRIDILSYGEERPFEQGHDEFAWAKNRRAHPVER